MRVEGWEACSGRPESQWCDPCAAGAAVESDHVTDRQHPHQGASPREERTQGAGRAEATRLCSARGMDGGDQSWSWGSCVEEGSLPAGRPGTGTNRKCSGMSLTGPRTALWLEEEMNHPGQGHRGGCLGSRTEARRGWGDPVTSPPPPLICRGFPELNPQGAGGSLTPSFRGWGAASWGQQKWRPTGWRAS